MSENKRPLGSNLAKVDATTDEEIARQIAEDPDTAPELTDEWFAEAEVWHGNKFLGHGRDFKNGRRVGRPKGSGTKEMVTLRLDKDVLERFRAGGPGWQTRLNDVLRVAVMQVGSTALSGPEQSKTIAGTVWNLGSENLVMTQRALDEDKGKARRKRG